MGRPTIRLLHLTQPVGIYRLVQDGEVPHVVYDYVETQLDNRYACEVEPVLVSTNGGDTRTYALQVYGKEGEKCYILLWDLELPIGQLVNSWQTLEWRSRSGFTLQDRTDARMQLDYVVQKIRDDVKRFQRPYVVLVWVNHELEAQLRA